MVILIPGIEGVTSALQPLARNLKMLAVCLQLGFENDNEQIQAMSLQLYNVSTIKPCFGLFSVLFQSIADQLDGAKDFTLVGYSYGCVITLELAALLEKEGMCGTVVVIDGAPAIFSQIVNQQINASTESQFQNNVLLAILRIYMSGANLVDIIVSRHFVGSTWTTLGLTLR